MYIIKLYLHNANFCYLINSAKELANYIDLVNSRY